VSSKFSCMVFMIASLVVLLVSSSSSSSEEEEDSDILSWQVLSRHATFFPFIIASNSFICSDMTVSSWLFALEAALR